MTVATPGTSSPLGSRLVYADKLASACWEGRCVDDRGLFERFLQDVVQPRVTDKEAGFEEHLRGLSTTGMSTDFLEGFLASVPPIEPWEVGEALAECAIEHDSGRVVRWPWNTVRDRRTPRASLPGSDLVGFLVEGGDALLLLGEVKTSSDTDAPPNVMYGERGMAWQLHDTAHRLDILRTLLQWLLVRCQSASDRAVYDKAVSRFLSSSGKEIAITGVLIRDTKPDERDLKSRAQSLSKALVTPTRVTLLAWYVPVPIAEMPALVAGGPA